MLTTDLSLAAIELCTVAGLTLTTDQQPTLASMLAREPDGRWTYPQHLFPPHGDGAVVDARVLAGIVLLDEDVLWSSPNYPATAAAFQRMVDLVEPLRDRVANIRRTRGDQRITMTAGGRLSFATVGQQMRGRSADLCVLDPRTAAADVMALRMARPNVQVVLYS